MNNLTKEQAIVISGYTGILICDFGDLHEEIEKRLGRPVWTHEMPSIEEEIKSAFRDDFMSLQPKSEIKKGANGEDVQTEFLKSDYVTHHNDWLEACTAMRDQAGMYDWEEADAHRTYWQKQIDTLNRLAEDYQ